MEEEPAGTAGAKAPEERGTHRKAPASDHRPQVSR